MITMLMGAGAGSRFNQSGHSVPKPFIKVDGQTPMFQYVAKKMGLESRPTWDTLTFVTRSAFSGYFDGADPMDDTLGVIDDVVFVPNLVAAGPAWSAAAASLGWHEGTDVLLLDSDCFVEDDTYLAAGQMSAVRLSRDTDAIVYAVRCQVDTDSVATVKTLERNSNILDRIVEGGCRKGELLNVGAYWFRSLGVFRNAVQEAQQHCKGDQELKLSDVVNTRDMLTEVHVLNGRFVNLGTPELLQAYQKEKGYATAAS